MPLTDKGSEILHNMEKTYPTEKKAKEVFYASRNAGTITGIDSAKDAVESYMDAVKRGDADGMRTHSEKMRRR